MKHRFAVGAFVQFRTPDEFGRRSDGSPFSCRVLEHLASDLAQPVYLVNEGCVDNARYQLIATEDELLLIADADGNVVQ